MSDEETEPDLAPRANPALYGHESAEKTLLDAYKSGKMAHAWLLCGPRGIGKATLAYRFARFVLAQIKSADGDLFRAPPPKESLAIAPDDPVFRRVASGGHADLLTVERTENERGKLRDEIVIEDTRRIGGFLHLTPAEGGWRVVVIDCAEEMNRNAANAVLKIVEEPPSQALILLVSHAPGRLLPTIRSRCRRLALNSLDEATTARILLEQRPEVNPADAAALARLAEGSAGRAIDLADQGGLALLRHMVGLLETLPRLDVDALYKLANRMGGTEGEAAFRTVTDLLLWWLVRLIRVGAGEEAPLQVVTGESELYRRLAARGGLDRWLEVWEKTRALVARAAAANLERKQVLLNAFLALEAPASV
ncbi:MAG TPA: DNA polymerase III subunit delta' [Alphaproteobacteria bacterium]|nr:DNA polymerase III subunit delta' [Alphaproteobacteria bacterium]